MKLHNEDRDGSCLLWKLIALSWTLDDAGSLLAQAGQSVLIPCSDAF